MARVGDHCSLVARSCTSQDQTRYCTSHGSLSHRMVLYEGECRTCSSSRFTRRWFIYLSLRCTTTFVIFSLFTVFGLFSPLLNFLPPLLFLDLSSHNPLILAIVFFIFHNLFVSLSQIFSVSHSHNLIN